MKLRKTWQGWVTLLGWLVGVLWSGWVQAQSLDLAQKDQAGPISLTPYFSVLEDKTRRLEFKDVLQPDVASQFEPVQEPGAALAFGYTPHAYWLRLELHNTSAYEVQRVLQIASWGVSYLDSYIPSITSEYQMTQTGSARAFQTRPYPSRHFVFPVTLRAHSSAVLYFRAQSVPLNIPAVLWEPQAFYEHERNVYMGQALYFGLALGMAVFNLLLFVSLRDRSFVLYVWFVLSLGLAIAENSGLAKQFLWQNMPWWTNIATSTLFAWTFASALYFCRNMLNIADLLPRWDKLVRAVAGLYVFLPLFYAMAYEELAYISLYLNISTLFLLLGLSVWGVLQRQRSAYWFLLAFVGVLLGGAAQLLRQMGWLPTQWFTEYGIQVGSALQMLLLAFALGDRFNQVRKDHARAKHAAVLHSTQQQQSEKMAGVGQVMSAVAAGVNHAMDRVRGANLQIPAALEHALAHLPEVWKMLDASNTELFVRLVQRANEQRKPLRPEQIAALADKASKQLERVGIAQAQRKANIMVSLNANTVMANYLPLLQHPQSELILETASSLSDIVHATNHTQMALEQFGHIADVVAAFARMQPNTQSSMVQIAHSLDTALAVLQPLWQDGKVVTQYQNIAALPVFADELLQLWTALLLYVHQHLTEHKLMTVGLRRADRFAVVSIHHAGLWLQEDAGARLLRASRGECDPTQVIGLDMVMIKQVLERHHGRLEVQGDAVQGLTLLVYLPYP
jgi:hypothetical protein